MKYLAILILSLACLTGSARADYEAGLDAYNNRDYATALKELKPLAEQGNAAAQAKLGYMHGNGKGVVEDYKEALKWYRKAAEQGYAIGQSSLGYVYHKGEGVPQDNIYAYMWFNIAATEFARERRDKLAKEMTPSQIEDAQRLAHECVKKEFKGC